MTALSRELPPPGSALPAPFPEGFRDREELAAQGWLYYAVCAPALLR